MQRKAISLALLFSLISATTANAVITEWKLPIKKYTPGAINPDVNQNNISSTICKVGWTATIRPSSSYTNKIKIDQLKTTYKSFAKIWGESLSAYEEDHLISLQLGGSPTNPKNLFPQPYKGNNAYKKDILETKLKKMVCSGTIKLADAQKAIASNWVKAFNLYASKENTTELIN